MVHSSVEAALPNFSSNGISCSSSTALQELDGVASISNTLKNKLADAPDEDCTQLCIQNKHPDVQPISFFKTDCLAASVTGSNLNSTVNSLVSATPSASLHSNSSNANVNTSLDQLKNLDSCSTEAHTEAAQDPNRTILKAVMRFDNGKWKLTTKTSAKPLSTKKNHSTKLKEIQPSSIANNNNNLYSSTVSISNPTNSQINAKITSPIHRKMIIAQKRMPSKFYKPAVKEHIERVKQSLKCHQSTSLKEKGLFHKPEFKESIVKHATKCCRSLPLMENKSLTGSTDESYDSDSSNKLVIALSPESQNLSNSFVEPNENSFDTLLSNDSLPVSKLSMENQLNTSLFNGENLSKSAEYDKLLNTGECTRNIVSTEAKNDQNSLVLKPCVPHSGGSNVNLTNSIKSSVNFCSTAQSYAGTVAVTLSSKIASAPTKATEEGRLPKTHSTDGTENSSHPSQASDILSLHNGNPTHPTVSSNSSGKNGLPTSMAVGPYCLQSSYCDIPKIHPIALNSLLEKPPSSHNESHMFSQRSSTPSSLKVAPPIRLSPLDVTNSPSNWRQDPTDQPLWHRPQISVASPKQRGIQNFVLANNFFCC